VSSIPRAAVATAQGVGAASSGLAAGLIVDRWGYSAAFLASSSVAATALVALAALMPETRAARPVSSAPGYV